MSTRITEADALPAIPRLDASRPSDDFVPTKDGLVKADIDDSYKSEGDSLEFGHSNKDDLAPRSEPTSLGDFVLRALRLRKQRPRPDPDSIATTVSVYDGPFAEEYQPIPEWENLRNFDPSFRWTHREERKVRRKIDLYVFAWILIMFLALDIDRGNMVNATSDGLLKDLGLTTNDYNLGNTLSKLGFLIAELPSQAFGKKVGVDLWLPGQLVIFSIFAFAQFWMKSKASFLALRFLIAFFQGGVIPDVILYLSYWFKNDELPLRIGIFFTLNFLSTSITAFLAVGLLKMRGIGGYEGWRWLVIGILSFFILAPSPSQTKSRWRPNGLFTDREEKIAVNRVVRDEPQKATMHNRQALTPSLLWKSAKELDMLPFYAMGILFQLPGAPIGTYWSIAMRNLGFSTVKTNLLAIPYNIFGTILLLLLVALSEAVNNRVWVASLQQWWYIPILIALRAIPNPAPWVYFALASLALSAPYAHAVQVSWIARNSGSVRSRTVTASLYNMSCQLSGIIGSNIYVASDAPHYYRGNAVLIGLAVFNAIILYPSIWLHLTLRNKSKTKQWDAMTVEEQKHYLATTKDEGSRRLDFRYTI
ncbi:hypothetical protein JCM8097_007635 [Rhodosporidiobolus ruineniae]